MKKNSTIKNYYQPKLLALSVAAVTTGLLATTISQASDIEIYQEAKSGKITLMMLLDISTSMNGVSTASNDLGLSNTECSGSNSGQTLPAYGYNRTYCTVSLSTLNGFKNGNATNRQKAELIERACNKQSNGSYHCGDRTARMKDAMYELLNGSNAKGVEPIANDKVIGLSTLGAKNAAGSGFNVGAILVPARALDEKVGSKTQRQILTEQVQKITAVTATPTVSSYAEVINYMMGATPAITSSNSGWDISVAESKVGTGSSARYHQPSSLSQTADMKTCSGQGVYVLTDGNPNSFGNAETLMRRGLGNTSFNCSSSNSGFDCLHAAAAELVNEKNPLKLKLKTAVVGFGRDFNNVASYDRNKTREENIAALGTIDTNVKRAALWGIIGEGGWYSGSSSGDVVDSVNHFINDLTTEIPAVTTGSPTIPKDALNPAILQDDAYYQQFQPTPDKSYQLWLGNLKKYFVDKNGILKGKDGNKVIDSDGKIIDNFDYWSEPVVEAKKDADANTIGSTAFALRGGAWSRVLLRTDPVSNPSTGIVQRKVFTNRIATGTGASATFGGTGALRQVLPTDLTHATYKNDSLRGYLIRFLGYNDIEAATPPDNLEDLKLGSEFRQTGAVMHSYPLLITNKGKLAFDKTKKIMNSTNREDYILFGTTQGALHVVKAGETKKAGGGREVFSFVPNEMLEKQRQAFEKPETTSGGLEHLFYGIDGAWTAYTEYVINGSGELTVGTGLGSQKGVQDVYGGLRMGGKSYYALDLKNMNAPELKFHIDPENQKIHTKSTSKTVSELQYMGQSWSKPTIGFVNWNGKRTRVMFVGGGYDMGYESVSYDPTTSKGNGVYMFDANNGDLLWWASASTTNKNTVPMAKQHGDLKYSVVSQIRTVDRDGDELVDHIYFGDLGGQIFRVDFDNKQKLAADLAKTPVRIFNGHLANGKSPRFYDMPAFSLYSDNGSIFAVVSQGSGNRSTPLFSDSTYNYDAMYNIYDKDVARKDLYSATSWNTKDIKADNSLGLRLITDADRKDDATLKAPFGTQGWYYEFKNCLTGKGACNTYTKQTEKVFGTPVVLNKKMFVSTFDASKDGLAGDCGAGVKGASIMTTFCMPFGQCKAGDPTGAGHSFIGPGIHTITVGNDLEDSTGGGSTGGGTGGTANEEKTSASNYCVNTGGRMTITISGGESAGEKTQMCLIPQRWYPKLY